MLLEKKTKKTITYDKRNDKVQTIKHGV